MRSRSSDAKCSPGRAHHWLVGPQDGSRYVWGRCKRCKKRRMFRTSWPDNANWETERETRLAEEKKARRREKRAEAVG